MTMTAREKGLLASSTDHEWTPEEEIQLFYAMGCLKPVGVNKHFYIACIAERLSSSLNRDYTTESVMIHLRNLYNLDALEDIEPLPFPNEEKEFSLPEEFSPWLSKKRGASEESSRSCEGPPSIIAVVTDNTTTTKEKSLTQTKLLSSSAIIPKELDKKIATKLSDGPKRTPKRTRGSMSLESNSPSTTPPPPPVQSTKRRRI